MKKRVSNFFCTVDRTLDKVRRNIGKSNNQADTDERDYIELTYSYGMSQRGDIARAEILERTALKMSESWELENIKDRMFYAEFKI